MNTSLARDIQWRYARPGDFAVRSGIHVVYIRATPRPEDFDREGLPRRVLTIESAGEHHRVLEWRRTSEEDRIDQYTSRRWVVPWGQEP